MSSRALVRPTALRRAGACRTSAAHVLRCALGTGLRAAVWASVFNLAASVRAVLSLDWPLLQRTVLLFVLPWGLWQRGVTIALMPRLVASIRSSCPVHL